MIDAFTPPVLVARDNELTALRQHLLRGGESGSSLVLVTGLSGMGSSALVHSLAADHVAAGGRCLQAQAVPWEGSFSFGVLAQLLGEPLGDVDILGAAARLVDALAGTPALVVVDDASWSDPESLQALSTAVRHHGSASVRVVLTDAKGRRDGPQETAMVLERIKDRIDLAPLDATAVQALAASRGTVLPAALADRLCRFTGGTPGAVLALLAELPTEFWGDYDSAFPAPAAVASDVAARMGMLTDQARDLAGALGVVGRAPVTLVASVIDLVDPMPAVDELLVAGLVTCSDEHGTTVVEPADPMVGAALLGSLGRARVAALHRIAAELVEDPVARLAHLAAASPLPDARLAEELDDLALERAQTGEWAAVAELLTSASRLTSETTVREDRLSRAFDALVGSGNILGAAAAVAEVESLRETPLRNAALGYLAIVRGRPGEAESRLARAWDLVNVERDPGVAALICQRRVLHSLARCRGADLVQWADRAIELAPAGSPAAVEAAAIRGLGVAATGQGPAALADYLRLADEVGHGAQAQRVAMGRGWLHLGLDDVDEARAALSSATSTDFLGGSTRISLWAHAWLARAQFVSGEWDAALRTAEQGSLLAERTGMRLVQPLMSWTQAQVHALRGDWVQAEAAVRAADAGPRDYEMMRVASCLARAGVAEARADYAGVLAALAPLRQSWAGGSIDEPGAWPWADIYANALVLEGQYDEADVFLRHHEQLATERNHRSSRARLGYARGRLLGATGDLPAARVAFEEAAGLLADLPLPFDLARLHFTWGQTLRRAGKRRDADPVLKAARDLYAGLGATTYVERCDRELRAGGVRTTRAAPAERNAETLTPQEELVTELVAKGMTNRAVASELFVSTKTVQYHLTRIYSKLGIRSRGELAALRGTASKEPEQS